MIGECNMLGSTHCGRVIENEEDVAARAGVHVNRGSQPHTWETHLQCKKCAAMDAHLRDLCDPEQATWRSRRLAAPASAKSLREMARCMSMGVAEYSALESMRKAATKEEVRKFNEVFPQ